MRCSVAFCRIQQLQIHNCSKQSKILRLISSKFKNLSLNTSKNSWNSVSLSIPTNASVGQNSSPLQAKDTHRNPTTPTTKQLFTKSIRFVITAAHFDLNSILFMFFFLDLLVKLKIWISDAGEVKKKTYQQQYKHQYQSKGLKQTNSCRQEDQSEQGYPKT